MSARREELRRIAIGGLAEIVLARERGPSGWSRLVVLKRLREDLAGSVELAEMLADEARLLARLEHPHIVRLYGARFDPSPELVLEHLDGPDLRRVIGATRGAIAAADVIDLGLAIAEGLAFAHARSDEHGRPLSVIHRDLTPRNVIVTVDGVVKVLDFGIAKARSNVYETATGVLRGTPAYMAPEQVLSGAEDLRVDVYSLGILLYELAAGAHPFARVVGAALHEAVLESGVPPLSSARPDLDPGLVELVYHCTRIDRDQRPPTMTDVVLHLAALRARHPEPRTFGRLAAFVARV